MASKKIYVTDYEYDSLAPEEREVTSVGLELVPRQCKTEDDVIRECADAAGLLDQYAPITRRVMESLPNLKVVARYGVGVNTVDLEAATELGICVLNVPDYCADEVSNHAFSLFMACHRKLVLLENQIRTGGWDYKIAKPIRRLAGQTLGLLGFGRIPRMLARKAAAFDLKLAVYDPFVRSEDVAACGGTLMSLEDVLRTSDIISVHVPLTKDTNHLLSHKEFSLMKPEAIVVNTSRGPLIDEEALCDALMHGKIAAAGLDVTEEEPLAADHPLRKLPNVIVTPHIAFYSEESELELKTKTARGAAEIVCGYDMPNIVNREVRAKLSLKPHREVNRSC